MKMRTMKKFAGLVALSGLMVVPAHAQLLSVGTSNSAGSSTTSVSVPSVADAGVTTGSTTRVDASLLNGGGSTANVDLSSLLGTGSGVNVTLPGTGNGSVDGLVGSTTGTTNSVTGPDGTVDTLLTSLLGNGGVATTGPIDTGGAGNLGGAGGIGGVGGPGGSSGSSASALLAGAAASANDPRCTSDAMGIAHLLQNRYSSAEMAQWQHATGVHVVKMPVCDQIRGNVARTAALNGTIGAVQGAAANDPLISASLNRAGIGANRVLGVGQEQGDLTVYVY